MNTSEAATYKPAASTLHEIAFGPATIEKRTDATPLKQLGTSFMTFNTTGTSEPWTLQYEETIYVISGHTEIEILSASTGNLTITGEPGDLLVLPEGTEVRYHGTQGTQLLLSITPVNWRDIEASVALST